MLEYLESLMNREPVLEDWEITESARYAFKYVQDTHKALANPLIFPFS